MAIKVRVTKDYIENSKRMDSTACMVHDAVCDALQLKRDNSDIAVHTSYDETTLVRTDPKTHRERELSVPHPTNVVRKIERWDDGKKVMPFEFDWELPEDWREELGLA
jgi:hypothetical protein